MMVDTIFTACRKRPTLVLLFVCLLLPFLAQQMLILGAWTPVPYVDTWPVFDRFMQLYQGQIGWPTYLLSPHGAHLHSIVYFLYLLDIYFFSGQQFLPLCASLVATLIMDGLFLFAFFSAIREKQIPAALAMIAAAAGVLFLNAPSGVNLHIFQVVLVASRTAYAALLLGMVYAFRWERWDVHAFLLALSIVAVTFHGSGVLFALIVAVLYIVSARLIWLRVAGFIPLIAVAAFDKIMLPPGTGEFGGIFAALKFLTFKKLWGIALGTAGYYSSSLYNFWEARSFIPDPLLLVIGATVMLTTGLASLCVLWKMWTKPAYTSRNPAVVFMALLSLLTFLSAFSATLFWAGREEIAPDAQTLYHSTLTSGRYACFAALAWMYFLFIGIAGFRDRGFLRARYTFSVLILGLIVSCLVYVTAHGGESFDMDADATRILADSKNVLPGIDSYPWRRADEDPFWREELPKLAQFMYDKNLSLFHDMPRMGDVLSDAPKRVMHNVKLTKLADEAGYCRVEASTQRIDQNIFHQPRTLAITDADNRVTGFSAIIPYLGNTSRLIGTVECPPQPMPPKLFIAL